MDKKLNDIEFVFNTWSEEITNDEFAETLGRRLKEINKEITISAKNDVFTIKYHEIYKKKILEEIENYSGGFFNIFKSTIRYIDN